MARVRLSEKILPLQQGSVDRLCGLYSAINAIIRADPNAYLFRQELFDCGCRFLIAKQQLNSVILNGMKPNMWMRLVKHLLRCHQDLTSVRLDLCHLFQESYMPSEEMWARLAERVNFGSPVLAELEGKHSHFTVITNITESRVILFDSDRLCWLHRSCCTFSTKSLSHPHMFIAAQLTAITLKSS